MYARLPNDDGTDSVFVTWPFFENEDMRTAFQAHNRQGALKAAGNFELFLRKRHEVVSCEIKETTSRVSLMAVIK
jgi:hypothetical protein